MSPNEHTQTCWQLDKKITLSVLIVIIMQVVGSVWWASDLSARVTAVELEQSKYEHVFEDIAEIKTDVKWIKGAIK